MATAAMTDHTRRLPAETLSEIIDWIDERNAMHASAHVCQRWRSVAFDRPRWLCWFDCRYQLFPSTLFHNDLQLALCLAKLKCRSDHGRMLHIHLDLFAGDTVDYILNVLASKIPYVEDLEITWCEEGHTEKVFDALSSQPAPMLSRLTLKREPSDTERSSTPATGPFRLPKSLFTGITPALNDITISGLELPEEPLPQFSAVTAVDFEPGSDPWCCQDLLTSHFPAMSALCVPTGTVVRLSAPITTEGRLLLGRLTQLYMNERMLNDLLDEYPELSTVSCITAWPDEDNYSRARRGRDCTVAAKVVSRMLAHFAHDDFLIDITDTPDRSAFSFRLMLSREFEGTLRRDIDVPLSLLRSGMGPMFDEARAGGHELRLTRAFLSGKTFTALWPVLPAESLRGVEVLADPNLPDAPSDTPPRVLPVLNDFVISRHLGLDEDVPPIVLPADGLAGFLRVTVASPIARLRLADVSVDEAMPELEDACTEVIKEGYLLQDAW